MRFGAPILQPITSPAQWIDHLRQRHYGAAYSPVPPEADDATVLRYAEAARAAGIVVAEQGAWGVNALSTDAAEREKAIAHCIRQLEIAELLGARCCVALSGSRAAKWDAPHADNCSETSFAQVVENTQRIIDAVQPKRTFFTLEPMPWTFPCDVESQRRLLRAVDRAAYAVHFDPVNMVYSPDRYYRSGHYIREYITALGPHIRVCHLKDVLLLDAFVFQLHERIPGDGGLDYAALFTALDTLDPDLPIVPEHLSTQADYDRAEGFIRAKVSSLGLSLRVADA